MKVAVSFIKSKYSEEETIKKIDKSIADYIHIDIMDGKFVEVKNYDFTTINYLFEGIKKDLDIHLMVSNPLEEIKKYILLKPKYITFHIEATNNPQELINFIHDNNIKAGIAINPDTPISMIESYLNVIDLVLVMGVYPGYGGQEFIPSIVDKINELMQMKEKYNYIVSVDGGINDKTISLFDADMVVSGSFVCKEENFDEQINKLKCQ